ncbi:unnamed protein product, partial [Musa hybrid cultivar]
RGHRISDRPTIVALAEVAVVTGEEDEDVLLDLRTDLINRVISGRGGRGTGDVKFPEAQGDAAGSPRPSRSRQQPSCCAND